MSIGCRHHPERRRTIRAWANRLILSRVDDRFAHAPVAIDEEVGGCVECWQHIAVYCATLASEHLVEAIGSGQTLIDEDNVEAWEAVGEAARVTIEDRIARDLDFGVTE